MVLVDTSVWIRFLANRQPYAAGLSILLDAEEVAAHEMVYGELLVGDRGGRPKLLADYQHMHYAITVPHREVVIFVRSRSLNGRGLGWIDVHLLASAIVERMALWTADERVALVAQEVGVAYKPPVI